MKLAAIQGSDGVPGTFLVVPHSFGPKLLDGNEYSHPITNFLDAHLLQHTLVAFDKVTSGDIIF